VPLSLRTTLVGIALANSLTVLAEDQSPMPMNHQQHMAAMAADSRQPVDFPPPMRQHILANMRDHLAAIAEILAAMAEGHYTQAATVADQRLGLDSPAAEGCQSDHADGSPPMSPVQGMDRHMAQLMPEGMRKIGYQMHEAASRFVTEAAQAAQTGNPKPALAALSTVMARCADCHSAFKVQ
jgi:hypothetical protein